MVIAVRRQKLDQSRSRGVRCSCCWSDLYVERMFRGSSISPPRTNCSIWLAEGPQLMRLCSAACAERTLEAGIADRPARDQRLDVVALGRCKTMCGLSPAPSSGWNWRIPEPHGAPSHDPLLVAAGKQERASRPVPYS